MSFVDRILKVAKNEGSVLRSALQVDETTGGITSRQDTTFGGQAGYRWESSVSAGSLDPALVAITDPDADGIRHLSLVCRAYRDAVTSQRIDSTGGILESRSVRLWCPLAGKVHDAAEIVSEVRAFLARHGARSPAFLSPSAESALAALRAELSPAVALPITAADGRVGWIQHPRLESADATLVVDVERPRVSGDRWTFELLSLDMRSIDCRPALDSAGLWTVTLPSIENLETTRWLMRMKAETAMSSLKVHFPGQAAAEKFAAGCADAVRTLREVL